MEACKASAEVLLDARRARAAGTCRSRSITRHTAPRPEQAMTARIRTSFSFLLLILIDDIVTLLTPPLRCNGYYQLTKLFLLFSMPWPEPSR